MHHFDCIWTNVRVNYITLIENKHLLKVHHIVTVYMNRICVPSLSDKLGEGNTDEFPDDMERTEPSRPNQAT